MTAVSLIKSIENDHFLEKENVATTGNFQLDYRTLNLTVVARNNELDWFDESQGSPNHHKEARYFTNPDCVVYFV